MISNIDSQRKQRQVKGGGAGLLQSMFAPVDRFCSGGLFAEYRRFYVAINSASSSGSGGNGRAAEISPLIDLRLEGATSYEIAEVFGRVMGTARGVTDATLYKMEIQGANPRESNVTWRVRIGSWERDRFQANVMRLLHAISEEEDGIMGGDAYTRSERDLLRAIRPGDSSSGTVVFVLDRDRLQEPC